MEYLLDAVSYKRAGWRTVSVTTRVSTLHALYRRSLMNSSVLVWTRLAQFVSSRLRRGREHRQED